VSLLLQQQQQQQRSNPHGAAQATLNLQLRGA
jgi:hypothetical protein